ncbi:MAG: anhydro-N-acetylmuramic acid kinase [Thermotogaceae bacterium]|nr:anhydro-N-acetylmuramic acid kinase [Thermotogaceae bacterium]
MHLKKILDELYRKKYLRIAGMMSGTSFDGIDIAIVDVKGTYTNITYCVVELCFHAYPDSLKEKIRSFIERPSMEIMAELDVEIAKEYVKALKNCKSFDSVEVVSMHGQTIWHIPRKMSLQIGSADIVAVETGKVVVSDFRRKDIAAGGEGAPLVPYVDFCVFSKKKEPIALINIGGISNVTVLSQNINDLLAFDMGPGNTLLDFAVKKYFGLDFDENGKIAKKGKIHYDIAKEVLNSDEYIMKSPPKSTGKEYYNESFMRRFGIDDPYDLVATLSYYTALSIKTSFERFILSKSDVKKAYFSGGGTKNDFMMAMIKKELEEIGVRVFTFNERFSDFKEAIWFSLLGNEFFRGKFSNVPAVTGAKNKVILGRLSLPY